VALLATIATIAFELLLRVIGLLVLVLLSIEDFFFLFIFLDELFPVSMD
jgi:hypothetical protein